MYQAQFKVVFQSNDTSRMFRFLNHERSGHEVSPALQLTSHACDVSRQTETEKMADVVNVGVNLDAFSHAINGIQALRSSVSRVFESLKDGMKNRETLEGREKQFIAEFQDNLQAVNRDLK